MSGSFRKSISIVDEIFSPDSEDDLILSMEILPDGLSYAILDTDHYRYLVLEHYTLADNIPGLLMDYDRLQSLFDQIALFKGSFQKAHVAYFSNHLVLLPDNISGFDDQRSLLQYSCQLPDNHAVKSDRLNNMNGFGVYSFPNWLLHLLESYFPFYRLRHTGSIFIESMLSMLHIENQNPDIVLHIRRSSFDIMWLHNKKLMFHHIYSFRQFDDLLYLLFFVMKQFGLKASEQHLMLAGDISLDSGRYKRLSSYFKRVSFAIRSDIYHYGNGFDNIPHHDFFTLLNMNACG